MKEIAAIKSQWATIVLLAAILVVVPLTTAVTVYKYSLVGELDALESDLHALAGDKSQRVERWLAGLRGDAQSLTGSPYMSTSTAALVADPNPEAVGVMCTRLRAETASGDFEEILLVDSAGDPIACSSDRGRAPDQRERALIAKAIAKGTTVVAAHSPDQFPAHVDVVVPILPPGDPQIPIAAVVERVKVSGLNRELALVTEAGRSSWALLIQAGDEPSVLVAGDGADRTQLSDASVAHTLFADWGPSDQREVWVGETSLVLMTRMKPSDLVLVTGTSTQAARDRALAAALPAIGWPALALISLAAVVQPVHRRLLRGMRRDATALEGEWRLLENRVDFVLRGTSEAFLVLDAGFRVARFNDQALYLYELLPEDLLGKPLAGLVADGRMGADADMIVRLQPGHETVFDTVHRRSSGATFPVRCRAFAPADDDGARTYELLVSQVARREGAQARIDRYQDKLRALASERADTEERERRRIAANLHDRVGQTLTLLRMQLGSLDRSLAGGPQAELIGQAKAGAERAIQEIRTLTCEISPPVLYELGLIPALEWLAEQTTQRFGVTVHVEHPGTHPELSRSARGALFAAVQELLMNVIKHSKASEATVTLIADDSRVAIEIADDGVGFDAQVMAEAQLDRTSFGLFSIRERLDLMGGRLIICSKAGEGTRVRVQVPASERDGDAR